MKFLFGPVNSRRLGRSLGIDLLPHKTCTLNCIYCECGPTTNLTTEVREYVPTDAVIEELRGFLSARPPLDIVTFAGSGEPTLHSGIGRIIDFLKKEFPEYPVAILTNGTLLWQGKIRRSLLGADIIIPSLDAVSADLFDTIGRPAPGVNSRLLMQGLIKLRSEFTGKIYLEVFIIPGVNDSDNELNRIREACSLIMPDRIQLNALDRPGSEDWVEQATGKRLEEISTLLQPHMVDVVGQPAALPGRDDVSADKVDAVIATIGRRPSTAEDLSRALGMRMVEVLKIMSSLTDRGVVEKKEMERGTFYVLKTNSS